MQQSKEYDVIVAGSGAAGLTAALAAAAGGLRVAVLEKSDVIGGTSAMSGAGAWIPANHYMLDAGLSDSIEEALSYIRHAIPDDWGETPEGVWREFIAAAPEMLEFIERYTPLRFELVKESDTAPQISGARAYGRMLSTKPLPINLAGSCAKKIRQSTQLHWLTYQEMLDAKFLSRPLRALLSNAGKIIFRRLTKRYTQGTALITGLIRGCQQLGCQIETGARVMQLVQDTQGRVSGAQVEQAGHGVHYRAHRGVILATGGFEWDEALFSRYFQGAVDFICSPPTNEGDGHRMAAAVGASLERMDQANLSGALPTYYEGRLHGMPLRFQCDPHAIVIGADGRRFGNEYDFNFASLMVECNPATGKPAHLPAWVIADGGFLKRNPIVRLFSYNQSDWLIRAKTLAELAGRIRVPADALLATVHRWNTGVAKGIDLDFGRDRSPSVGYTASNPGLGAIVKGPYLAMRFNISTMGTKGGPRTDARGRVLGEDSAIIHGLYCAGAAMANPIGTLAVGTGTTIGPVMTWGYICGRDIARRCAFNVAFDYKNRR